MVSLRMIDPVTFKVADTSRGGEIIDQIEYSRAFFELFAGMCDSPHYCHVIATSLPHMHTTALCEYTTLLATCMHASISVLSNSTSGFIQS
jgi:hypothetical protein